MGGGRAILTPILTFAIVGAGNINTNIKPIIPKSNFLMLHPPFFPSRYPCL
jgi:hypothetical protein